MMMFLWLIHIHGDGYRSFSRGRGPVPEMATVANWDWPPYRYLSLFWSSVNFLHHITVAIGISPGTGIRTRLRVCEQAIRHNVKKKNVPQTKKR